MNNITKVTTAIFENSKYNKLRISLESAFNSFDDQAKELIVYGEKSKTLFAQSQMFLKFEWLSDTGTFTDNRKVLLSAYSFTNLKAVLNDISVSLQNPDLFVMSNGVISGVNQNAQVRFELNNIGRKNRSLIFHITADSLTAGAPIEPLILIEFLPEKEGQTSVYSVLRIDDFILVHSSLKNLDFVNAQLNHINSKLISELLYGEKSVKPVANTPYSPRPQGQVLPTYPNGAVKQYGSASAIRPAVNPAAPNSVPAGATITPGIPSAFTKPAVQSQPLPIPQAPKAPVVAPVAPVIQPDATEDDVVASLMGQHIFIHHSV